MTINNCLKVPQIMVKMAEKAHEEWCMIISALDKLPQADKDIQLYVKHLQDKVERLEELLKRYE